MTSVVEAKARLRAELRARRAALTPTEVAEASAAVIARLVELTVFAEATKIAAYRAVRGEICLDALLGERPDPRFTLPRVVGDDLEFVGLGSGVTFEPGAFGILEPVGGEVAALADHDVVLVPLVAFDARCHRLGQGGGFYDRALGALKPHTDAPAPVTIGVAHWFQQVAEIPLEATDIALDAVVTDRRLFLSATGRLAPS